jgi:hypothetical protein
MTIFCLLHWFSYDKSDLSSTGMLTKCNQTKKPESLNF